MVQDPYKVLGISRDASKEEIKKAYRKKAKEYHPDLHPNDPTAAQKMNEINEAYDMLNNPEKYKKQEQNAGGYNRGYGGPYGSGYGNSYGNSYGQAGNSYGQSGNGYGQNGSGYGQNTQGNRGYGNQEWQQGGFGYYDFEDLFGFGRSNAQPQRPTAQPGDSSDIRQVIDLINMGQYQYANQTLNSIISSERNARWYYLSALANQGLGNQMFAQEQIRKAMQMDPANEVYQRTSRSMSYSGTAYSEAGQEYRSYAESMNRMCTTFCLLNFFCMFCRC